ncbi:hypothetical protein ACCQ05_18805 [Xanthomonas sp. NCPPB 3582]|uniref:hypothetical protein n=1 Tax=Xanthomonas sp. NCPPB 3582 TaxID=487557 RepID=UPI003558C9F5
MILEIAPHATFAAISGGREVFGKIADVEIAGLFPSTRNINWFKFKQKESSQRTCFEKRRIREIEAHAMSSRIFR